MDGGRCLCTQTGIESDHGMISKKEARQCMRLRGAQLPGPTSVLVARVALSEKCSCFFFTLLTNHPCCVYRSICNMVYYSCTLYSCTVYCSV